MGTTHPFGREEPQRGNLPERSQTFPGGIAGMPVHILKRETLFLRKFMLCLLRQGLRRISFR